LATCAQGAPDGNSAQPPQNQAARPNRPPPKHLKPTISFWRSLPRRPNQRGGARSNASSRPAGPFGKPEREPVVEARGPGDGGAYFDTAREIAQKLTTIAPNFREALAPASDSGGAKRRLRDALTSLRHTLALQPKNFAALAELGSMLEEYNDKPHALDAYRQAKAINPFIDGVEDRIRELTKTVEGQGI